MSVMGCRVEDYESDDGDVSIINGGTKLTSAHKIVKEETNGGNKANAEGR
jgi:hypothetical protein